MKRTIVAVVALAIIAGALPAFADATPNGAALYKAKCAMCHGADGKGKTPLATAEVQKMSNDELAKITADGKPPKMPAYKGKLTAEEIQAVVAHIKSLK
jgi:cytochrome c6